MADVFISYRTDDEAYAAVLLDEKLCERFGSARIFRDSRSIRPGEDFRPELWGALAKATVLIVVIGQGWLRPDEQGRRLIDDPHDFVRREVEWALRIGIHVVPVLVGKISTLRAEDLPKDVADLAHRQYRRLSPRSAPHEIARIVDDVAGILDAAGHPGGGEVESPPGTAALVRIEDPGGRYEALRAAIDAAATRVELSEPEITNREFGVGVFLPQPVPAVRLVTGFVTQLDAQLVDRDIPPARIGICQGTVDDAFAFLTELVCLPELAGVLRGSPRARLVLVVPDVFFDEVVRANPRMVDPSTFLPFATRAGARRHWAHVPGYPAPPGLVSGPAPAPTHAEPAPTQAGQDATRHVPTVADNHGIVLLNQGPGNQYAGDHVMGTKHVHGEEVRRS